MIKIEESLNTAEAQHMFKTNYVAKFPDANGNIHYNDEENSVWHDLFVNQMSIIKDHACDEYLQGLDILNFLPDRVPEIKKVNQVLNKATGWAVEPVNALISHNEFFDLLANKKFPAACFIRRREEFQYVQEPDIFHELFGHCPMITNQAYADFMQAYGKLALSIEDDTIRNLLARLYWFTIEFGLINESKGLRNYGGGILSSPEETVYAIKSDVPTRKPLDALDAFRTPFRIDILQTVYFVIDDMQELYHLTKLDLAAIAYKSIELGEFDPTFPAKDKDEIKKELGARWC